jgi:membrane protein YdbS with pleckstrin-like domain
VVYAETAPLTWCYHARVQISTSVKTIQIGYIVCLLAAIGIAGYLLAIHNQDDRMWALLALPALAALYLLVRHIQRKLVKLTILDDRLRYEAGFLTKTTRTMELAKVQDVRVDQTVGQRMLNIGNLSLETAGESSRIVMPSVDRPHEAADRILDLSRARHPGV